MNIKSAYRILKALAQKGCTEVVLCPGARNAAFVEILSRQSFFKVMPHFDERGAAFFALSRTRDLNEPVAVITTSGTAVAECLPAVIEAYYQEAPLVIVSADRPQGLRGTGAPQAIDQSRLLEGHCETVLDFNAGEKFSLVHWSGHGPVHINVCFDEPLWSESELEASFSFEKGSFNKSITVLTPSDREWLYPLLKSMSQPLVLIGGLETQRERSAVQSFLRDYSGAVYMESTSGLRTEETIVKKPLRGSELAVEKYYHSSSCDGVIRIGSVPTLKFWRKLDSMEIPILSLSEHPFSGLRAGNLISGRLDQIMAELKKEASHHRASEEAMEKDEFYYREMVSLFEKYPQSEPSLFRQLWNLLKDKPQIVVGNSLPIRHWDMVSEVYKSPRVLANRGVNGIDGQIASSLGFAFKDPVYSILGDLTSLYDMNSLALLRQTQHPIKLFIVNNSGGRIFERIFDNSFYLNSHDFSFQKLAEQFHLEYRCVEAEAIEELELLAEDFSEIIELRPNNQQSRKFWEDYQGLFE